MEFNSSDNEKLNLSPQPNTTTFSPQDFRFSMASSFPNPNRPSVSSFPSSTASPYSQFEFKAGISDESSSDSPKPLESLHEAPIPPFLSKTYDLVDDPSLDPIISWGENGNTFVVRKPLEFARLILPRNFKHNNFSSFVRQLNTYGFRKVGMDKWEFANEGFVKGQRHLLRSIQRRRSQQSQQIGSFNDPGKAAMEGEVECLRKERSLMLQELVQLQQEQRGTAQHVEVVKEKLEAAEKRQMQMVSFLAKMLQKPAVLACLKQGKKQKSISSVKPVHKCIKLQPDELATSPKRQPTMLQPQPCDLAAPFGAECSPSRVEGTARDEMATVHQPQCLDEYSASFPRDSVTELPDFMMAGAESMDTADVWDMGYQACSDIPASWDTLTNADMLGLGANDGLTDIWGLGTQQSAGSLGFERWDDGD